MALTVETGAIVSGANAYASIATADAYHSDRGNVAWGAATDAQKSAALINATAYVDGKYRRRLKGGRVQPYAQPLEWPRAYVDVDTSGMLIVPRGRSAYFPSNVVPSEVVAATCEAALRALSAPLAADIVPTDRMVRDKTDVLETEYAAKDWTVTYQTIDQLMARFLRSPSEAVRG